jgi:hypothetical protein
LGPDGAAAAIRHQASRVCFLHKVRFFVMVAGARTRAIVAIGSPSGVVATGLAIDTLTAVLPS